MFNKTYRTKRRLQQKTSAMLRQKYFKKHTQGFQLIEALIAIAILGIIASLSYPIYSHHLVQVRRLEATTTLAKLAVALEQYYLIHHSYQNATLETLHFSSLIADNNYQIAIQHTDNTTYRLTATPLGKQRKNDKTCGQLILYSNGERGVTGSGRVSQCW